MRNESAQLDAIRERAPAHKPLIGITMGDPGGIGAEVIVKALADSSVRALGRFIIYGMQEPLEIAADLAELDARWFRMPHEDVAEVTSGIALADYDEFSCGVGLRRPGTESGQASLRFVEDAVRSAMKGRIDAVVTSPIHKISWKMAGCRMPGHTELLCELCNAKRVSMMFAGGPFRIALASTHVGLFELRAEFTLGRVFQPIDLLDNALRRWWGVENPRIAVAALNPHASEGGLFGDEEARIIEPAIAIARDHGIDATGPYPADTLFRQVMNGRFDGVVAMYHDQGLIPVKLLAFEDSVNITLGLPIIRTSVDHGTAFDIAGKNKACAGSMRRAIEYAAVMASQKSANMPPERSSQNATIARVPQND